MFIVAECGVNWRNIAEARRMIGYAASVGADAVKFQVYRKMHIENHPRCKELEEIILNKDDLYYLKATADGCGIEFMATPMFVEAVDWLEDIGVKRYKIRCADQYNMDLIHKIVKTNKPFIMSVDKDYSTTRDLMMNSNRLLAFCNPEYPPSKIIMPHIFNTFSGFSSHYTTLTPPIVAAARGCEYIEVHVKLDKYSPKISTDLSKKLDKHQESWKPIDDAVSINMSQLSLLCKIIRKIEDIEEV